MHIPTVPHILDELAQFGFEPVTEWIMKGDKIGPFDFKWVDHGGWLYAFVVDGEVKYIGLTDRVLRSRLCDYSHIRSSQTTRLRENICGALASGRRVQVFGWKQRDKAILIQEELRLRRKCLPAWNRV